MKLTGKATAKKTLTGKISGCEKIYISADTSDATATEDDIAIDKTAYVRTGKTTGRLPIVTSIAVDGNASLDEQGKIQIAGSFDDKRAILEKSASVSMSAPASDFGDASAEDVAKGKKFTSANGLNVTGTRETFTPSGTRVITMNGKHYIADYEYAQVEVAAGGDVVVGGDIEVDDLSELHSWNKYSIGETITKIDDTNVFLGTAQHNTGISVEYANKVDTSSGQLALSTEGHGTVKVTSDSSGAVLKGKVVRTNAGLYYEIPTTATVDFQSGTLYDNLYASEATRITYTPGDGILVGIVVSEDSNAYPQNGEQDGYKYVYNGTLDDAVKEPVLRSETVTPSEMEWTVIPGEGYDGLSSVTVKAISSTYVGSGVTKKEAQAYTPGDTAQEIPAGVYLTGKQTINPVPTQSKTATENGTITPDPGKYLSSVEVNVPPSGVELPALSDPGTESDMAKGKQLIGADGKVVTGNVATTDPLFGTLKKATKLQNGASPTGASVEMSCTFEESLLIRAGDTVSFYSETNQFGDATAADVRTGKTFTSGEGLVVVGTNAFRDIKNITIEEV